jgi:hypothetical protein
MPCGVSIIACGMRTLSTPLSEAAARTSRAGVRVAQQTPYNLVDRSGTVLAARVSALAERLFAERWCSAVDLAAVRRA